MLDRRAVHLKSEIGSSRLDEWNLLCHFNHLLGLGQFQLPIQSYRLAGFDHDSRDPDRGKVARLDLDHIRSGRHERETVRAIVSCRRGLRDIRADVGDRHCRIRHYGSCGIGNRAGDDALHGL